MADQQANTHTFVLTFESTHAAMAASNSLSSGGFAFVTIPTPTAISASCGIALKFDAPSAEPFVARVFGANRQTGLAALWQQRQLDQSASAGQNYSFDLVQRL